MKLLIRNLAVLLVSIGLGVAIQAQNSTQCGTVHGDKKVVFYATPVTLNNTNSDGVSRIGVNLQGLPHSSNRIDDVVLYHGGKQLHALDIDGVDFKRYFQWEDNGELYIEVDFLKQPVLLPSDSISFLTVNGVFTVKLGKLRPSR